MMSTPQPGTQSAQTHGVRFTAIRHLQERLAGLVPGTFAYDVADHAITLALSLRRPTPNPTYLQRNALRDARRVLGRARWRMRTDPFNSDTPLSREIEAGMHPAAVESTATPETQAAASLLLNRIEGRVAACMGSRGLRCLLGMLEGEAPDESAAAMRVSSRTVDRLRARVRAVARECVGQDNA